MKSLNLKWLRKNIGVVSQEPVLFDMTIAENIKFGAIHDASQNEIEEAAKMANAHDFIVKLPDVRMFFTSCLSMLYLLKYHIDFSKLKTI